MSDFSRLARNALRGRPIKFLFAGLVNTAFGYMSYALLIYWGMHYLLALFLATVFGVIFNFINFGIFVFDGKRTWHVFLKFIAAYVLIYLANSGMLILLTRELLFSPYLGQVFCIPPSVVMSWFLMKF
jgi:putative flippase GtrA